MCKVILLIYMNLLTFVLDKAVKYFYILHYFLNFVTQIHTFAIIVKLNSFLETLFILSSLNTIFLTR